VSDATCITSARFGRRSTRLLALAGLPAAAALTLAGGGDAAATVPSFTIGVGIPTGGGGPGEVYAVVNGGGVVTITETGFGLPHPAGERSRFGAAVLTNDDLNGGGNAEMIVGAPGSGKDTGRVDVFLGSDNGIVAAGAFRLQSPVKAGDEFGAALAIGDWDDEENSHRVRDLWVGAPGRDVAGKVDAGAVFRFQVSAAGSVSYVQTLTENSPGVPGSAQTGDRFGAVLARGGFAGIPGKDIGGRKDAGTVLDLKTRPVSQWNQNSPGVAGTAEAGDRFGAAVSAGPYSYGLIIGAPGEDVGTVKEAGLVQTFVHGETLATVLPWKAFSQNSAGVPGTAEAGDRFGAAVTSGFFQPTSSIGGKSLYAVVGSPGEDVGTIKDAGAVTVIHHRYHGSDGGDGPEQPTRSLRQGNGLPGTAETGDATGASLGWLGEDNGTRTERDILMIGVPGEDVGTTRDQGAVILNALTSASVDTGPGVALQHFGTVLAN
jgi:hypothetical protein